MKLRRALGFAALGIGAAVATNAALERSADELQPALDGMQRSYRWRGMDVSYTEAGDPEDPDLVLVHGLNAAASAGEWRAVIDALSEEYHVVAPDLPGFGNSERPPLRYSAALYEDFLAEFLAEFEEPAVLASSLSGAYVTAVAENLDLSRLVLVCPSTTAGPSEPKPWLRELIRLPLVGQLAFNLVTSKRAIRYFNADHGYADPDDVDEEWEAYEWQTAHQPNARFAPASFVSGYLNSELDLATALADLDVPVTILWGREADISPVSQGTEIAEAADCELVVFDDAKFLPHVERADAVLDYVLDGDLPDDESAVVEYDPDRSKEETAAADTDAAASTDSLVDETEAEAGRAEPAESAGQPRSDPNEVSEGTDSGLESDEADEGTREADETDATPDDEAEGTIVDLDDEGSADGNAEEGSTAETDAAASTGSMVDQMDDEDQAAEPGEAAGPSRDDPDDVDASENADRDDEARPDGESDHGGSGGGDADTDSNGDTDADEDDGDSDGDEGGETDTVEADGGDDRSSD